MRFCILLGNIFNVEGTYVSRMQLQTYLILIYICRYLSIYISISSHQLSLIDHYCLQFHTHQLLMNDIMEGTEMRRGAPCWYKHPEVGLTGINDASLVQSAMFSTIKRHFHSKMYYKTVLETFNEVC